MNRGLTGQRFAASASFPLAMCLLGLAGCMVPNPAYDGLAQSGADGAGNTAGQQSGGTAGQDAIGGSPGSGSSGLAGLGGSTDAGGLADNSATASSMLLHAGFETGTDNWRRTLEQASTESLPQPVASRDRALTGNGSLRLDLNSADASSLSRYLGLEGTSAAGIVAPIKRVVWHLWLPLDHKVTFVQAYVLGFNYPGGRGWEAVNHTQFPLRAGDWTRFEITFADPYPISRNGNSLGFHIVLASPWAGSVYIDDVTVEMIRL